MAELLAGRAFVDLIPRVSPAGAAAAEAQTGAMFSGIAGKAKIAGLAIGAGLVAGTIGVGIGLFKLGSDFHDAFAKIRVDTGQTGAGLDGLEGSFKKVLSVRPDSMDDVALAISKLNVGLGDTGPNLENLSVAELRLAKITKEDLGGQLKATSELFNNWGIAGADQVPKLDEVFRASQATGVSVTDLASAMASGGPLLRTAGLDFEESAALVGLLGKSGVSTTSVMAPLSRAIATAAKEGKNAGDVLRDTFSAIKNAPNDTAAAGAAIDVFGAKAGPRLAGLIREGKISYEELAKSIATGQDTIQKAATDTSSLGGKFAVFRNKIAVALEPLGTTVFDTLNNAAAAVLPALGDGIGQIAEIVRQLFTILTTGDFTAGPFAEDSSIVDGAFRIRDVLIEVRTAVKEFFATLFTGKTEDEGSPIEKFALTLRETVLPIIQTVAGFVGDNLTPILIGLGAAVGAIVLGALVSGLVALAGAIASPIVLIAALVAGLIYAYNNFDAFRNIVDTVARFLVDVVVPAVASFVAFLSEQIANLADWWREHWTQIQEAVSNVVAVISAIIQAAVAVISFVWEHFGDTIMTVVRNAFEDVRATIQFGVDLIRGIVEFFLAVLTGDWSGAWDALVGIVSSTWDFVTGLVGRAVDTVKTLIGDGLETAVALGKSGLDKLVGWFAELPGRLATAAGNVFGFLWDSFRSVIDSVIGAWNDFEIPSFHIHVTMPSAIPNIDFDTPSIPFPDIPLLAKGGRALKAGLGIVGDAGPELVNLGAGATIAPLSGSDRAEIFGKVQGFHVEHLEVPTMVNATADEVVDAMDAKLGWKFSGRNDR